VMDFAQLVAYESGSLEVLEFSWPPAAEDQAPSLCSAYVIMKRPTGFLLCIPEGFLSQEERDLGQQPAEDSGIGPSTVVSASPLLLTAEGNWIAAQDQERLSALVVDMSDHMVEQLAPADLSAEELVCFRQGEPMLFPLASEVLKQSKEWLLGTGNLPDNRSGYQTAASATQAPAPRPKPPKPKRPTVQQLAAQQAQMMQLMTSVVERLDGLQAPVSPAPGPPGLAATAPPAAVNTAILQKPLASVLRQASAAPRVLAQAIGPPPPTRAQPPAAPAQVDLEETALVALVGQLASGSGDPLLEATGQAASVKGAANRARLQEELAGRSGAFADKIRANMGRRMDPTHLMAEEQISFMRYLERHGSFSAQPLLGLLAWQTAQALDLLAAGSEAGARDTLSLMLLMMEQTALDGGNSSLSWLPTLQAEPPQSLFQAPASVPGAQLPVFSALAEQKWVTTALAYAKELDTISVRELTKKQQRAAAWAARKVGKAVFLGWCPWTLDYLYLRSLSGLPFAPGSSLREEGEFTFESWIAALPRLLKRGRVFHQRSCRNASDRRALAVRRCVPLNPAQVEAYRRIELSGVVSFVERCGLTPGAYPGDGALPEEAPFLPHADHGFEALHPYRDLRADQVALHGEGKWDLAAHLGPDLYMPFVEPQVLHFAGLEAPHPSFAKEKPDHLIGICRLWDASSLLGFVPGPLPDKQLTRLFGAYKAPGKLPPNRFLPSGPLLCRVHVPAGCSLVGSVTDRRDFYTQAMISEERVERWTSRSGFLPPSFQESNTQQGGTKVCLKGGGASLLRAASVLAGDFVPGSFSASLDALSLAKLAYESEEVAGATYLGFPTQKRLSLAAASARAAECPCISEELVSCLTGSWVSALMYRRCLMSALDGLFSLGSRANFSSSPSSPVVQTNLSAAPSPRVYASDASDSKGAFCSAPLGHEESLRIWLASESKGHAVRLSEEKGREVSAPGLGDLPPDAGPKKPLACSYDCLEVSVSQGALSENLGRLGFYAGPVIDPARSRHFRHTAPRLLEWILFLLSEKRPPLRSAACPEGFDATEPRTREGNKLALAHLCLLRAALRCAASLLVSEAVVEEGFAGLLAKAFAGAISEPRPAEPDRKRGLENLAVNDLLLTASWKTEDPDVLEELCGFAGLSSASAGWLRLSLLLARKDFDACFGFPGEGPIGPRNLQDEQRKQARGPLGLPEGRPVLPRTKLNRASLLDRFSDWLGENGFEREAFMQWCAEALAKTLEQFGGRELFEAGRPYWHYAETINAISARRPAVRRTLQGAWDLAFSWLALEPYTHHVAMPAVILLALLSVCLTWGWRAEAGIFALAWGALLRIGEATGAVRSSLVLPRDTLWSQAFILLKIDEPKTRLRTARHQAAKVEAQDLVQLIDLAFAHLPAYSKLWPLSAQTLRKRLDSALDALQVPTTRSCSRPLDLGSFRPGGATFVLQATEDAELVRRRGRWVSAKVMEILSSRSSSIDVLSVTAGYHQKAGIGCGYMLS
ncbi:unnamed protein product, partial [Symbiodinium necroappetens]